MQPVEVPAAARVEHDALAEQMLLSVLGAQTPYAELELPVLAGPALDSVRSTIDLFCALLKGDPGSQHRARLAVCENIVEGHKQGLPSALAFDAAGGNSELLWSALVDGPKPSTPGELVAAADRILEMADVLVDLGQISDPLSDGGLQGIEQRSRTLLERLLDPDAGEPSAEQMRGVGFVPADRYRVMVAVVGLSGQPRSSIAVCVELRRRGALAVTHEDCVIGVLGESFGPIRVSERVTTAVSEPLPRDRLGIELEFTTLFARVARELGRRGEIAPDDLLTERLLLRSRPLIDQVMCRVIEPLADKGQRTELVETLVAYVEADFDRRVAANVLHLHPGSVQYRLRRIEEVTGLRFDRSEDVILLTLAARAQQLAAVVS